MDAVIGSHSHTNPSTGFGVYKYLPAILAGPNNVAVLVTQAYRYNTYLGEVSLGLLPEDRAARGLLPEGEAYEVVSKAGRYIAITTATFAEDPTIKALLTPYQNLITAYNDTVLGDTEAPLDAQAAYTQETNAANLQADASVAELENNGIPVDFHLSGAMTNSKVAATATPSTPVTLKVSDMFSLMPYENSLVVMEMNGPQIKAVLERSYRNYYYYKYVAGYGGYSYYTTCFLDTNSGNQIVYRDTYPALPDGDNVVKFYYGRQAHRLRQRLHVLPGVVGELPGRRGLQLQRFRDDAVAAGPDRRRHAVLRA